MRFDNILIGLGLVLAGAGLIGAVLGKDVATKYAAVEFDNNEVILCDIVANTSVVVHVDCTTKGK